MQLGPIRPGDIVRVEKKGRVFEAHVIAKRPGDLEIRPIARGISYRSATAREVTDHLARRARRATPTAGRVTRRRPSHQIACRHDGPWPPGERATDRKEIP